MNVKEDKSSNTVSKAFAVLRCFIDGQEEWGVRELAAVIRQPTSSVHRLLKILRREGYLEFDPAVQRYRVGLEFVRVASVIAKRTRLGPTALPVMRELVERTDESVWLAIYEAERGRVVYIEEQAPKAIFPIPGPVGREFPVATDIAGWAVLAALKDEGDSAQHPAAEILLARERGYALEVSHGRDPIVKLSAAIFSSTGLPIGAIVIAIPNHRYQPQAEAGLAASLMNAAAQISERLGAKILGGASTGSWNDGVQVIAGLLRRHLPGIATVPSMGGGSQNLIDLQEGRGTYCITTVASARAAYAGRTPFPRPMPELRNVMSLSHLTLHIIVRHDVQIASFADLMRLRVSPGLSGFSSYQLFQELVATVGGRSPGTRRTKGKDRQVIALDFAEAARQLAMENIDAIFGLIVGETSIFKSVVEDGAGHAISLDRHLVDQILEAVPGYERARIPPRTYANQREAIDTIAVGTLLATTSRRKDDEVARVAKTIFEQRDELSRVSRAYRDLTLDFARRDIGVPFHAGSERYWSEQGASEPRPGRARSDDR